MTDTEEKVINSSESSGGRVDFLTDNIGEQYLNMPEHFPEPIDDEYLFEDRKPKIIYKLQDYEAPIELLYELIKEARINIDDLFISDITGQYVEIVANTPKDEIDYEYMGMFLKMASDLLYFKSNHALPRAEEDLEECTDEEERDFLNKIKEYALLREESEKLKELETVNRFYREPQYSEKDCRVAIVNFSLPKLIEAFARVLANQDVRKQEIIPRKVVKDRFSVNDQMNRIMQEIKVRREMLFTDIFEPDYDRSDIVTTFLAVLELVKYGRLGVNQEEIFGEIRINVIEGMEDVPIILEESDYGKY